MKILANKVELNRTSITLPVKLRDILSKYAKEVGLSVSELLTILAFLELKEKRLEKLSLKDLKQIANEIEKLEENNKEKET